MSAVREQGRGSRNAQATAVAVLFLLGAGVTALCLTVPGSMDPRGGLLLLAVVVFVAAGLWVVHARHLTPRSSHVLVVVALLGGNTMAQSVVDPELRALAAGWNLLIVMLFSPSLPWRSVLGCAVAACAAAGAAVWSCPGDPLLRGLRVVAVVCLVAVALAFLLGLRRELDAALAQARDQARHDALTGLLNRRGLVERFATVAATAARSGQLLAVTSFDLDHFKRVNDTWGHAVGDRVLVAAARALVVDTRCEDLVVRLGGEELAVVQVVADRPSALAVSERLRASIARECGAWSVSASAGLVVWDPSSGGERTPALEDLLHEADRHLYRAKAAGRDRVVSGV